MPHIDSHQHFWNFDPVRDNWITGEMAAIRRDFLPDDLAPILRENHIEGCVAVQANQSEEENEFLLGHAGNHSFIKGIVGWIDLLSSTVEERLAHYSNFDAMKGFRHILQGEKDRAFMLQPSFVNGISLLHKYDFTYDILIFPDQLKYSLSLVRKFPNQPFVIDHIAKPYIKDRKTDGWKEDIKAIAACGNVYCKISGMVTEADWAHWKKEDFAVYLDTVVNAFGIGRIMYGSDWPVCLVAGGYAKMLSIVKDYFSAFTQTEQDLFFGDNAVKFYNLNV